MYLSKPDNQKVIGFELIPIQPLTVERRLDRFVQYIPKEVTQGKLSQYVQLSPERILIFNLPTYVQKNFNHMMESLAFLSDNILPEFALLKGGAISKIPFDSEVHLRTQKLALADAGKLIGWNARGLLQREMLEYYFVHRQLLFERFKIKLLDKILATLNEGLARAGKEIEFSGRLEVEGLPTILDVDAAQAHLAKGDKSFKEILKPFLKF